MVETGYLAGALAMGAVVVGVAVVVHRRWGRRSADGARPAALAAGASDRPANYVPGESAAKSLSGSLAAYAVGYFLVVAVTVGGTLLLLLGHDVGYALAGVVFALATGAVFLGVYQAARNRRHSTARATAEGMTTVIAVLLVAVVVKLLAAG